MKIYEEPDFTVAQFRTENIMTVDESFDWGVGGDTELPIG